MKQHEKINSVEFHGKDLPATKAFFESAFGWSFVDYGPDYIAFTNEGLDGGFFESDLASSTQLGAALIVLYSGQLEETLARVEKSGGRIVKPIFSFPGAVDSNLPNPVVMSSRCGANSGYRIFRGDLIRQHLSPINPPRENRR